MSLQTKTEKNYLVYCYIPNNNNVKITEFKYPIFLSGKNIKEESKQKVLK
jgi:hypothetical protein